MDMFTHLGIKNQVDYFKMKQKFENDFLRFKYSMLKIAKGFMITTFIIECIFLVIICIDTYYGIHSNFIAFAHGGVYGSAFCTCSTYLSDYRKANKEFRKELALHEPWWKLKEHGGWE